MAETGTTETAFIDVREAVKDLEKHDLTETQANGIASFHLNMIKKHFATKSDLRAMESRIDAKFAAIDVRFADVDTRFADVDTKFAKVDTKLAELRTEMARSVNKLLATQFATAGLIIAALKYLP